MKLIKVRTYAEQKGYSVQYVYQLIKQDKVESEKIDGVTFVKVKK